MSRRRLRPRWFRAFACGTFAAAMLARCRERAPAIERTGSESVGSTPRRTASPVIVAVPQTMSVAPASLASANADASSTDRPTWQARQLPSALNVDAHAEHAGDPSVAIAADGAAVAAWSESPRVYVRRWSGDRSPASEPIAFETAADREASAPTVRALRDRSVVVAWREAPASGAGEIRASIVRDGTSASRRTSVLVSAPGRDVESPRLVLAGATPVLAWRDRGGVSQRVHIRRWDGTSWRPFGENDSVFSEGVADARVLAHAITSAPNGDVFVAAVRRALGTPWRLELRRITGAGTVHDLPAPNESTDGDSTQLSCAAAGTALYVVFTVNAGLAQVHRLDLERGTWSSVGLPDVALARGGAFETVRLASHGEDAVTLLVRASRLLLASYERGRWTPSTRGLPPDATFALMSGMDADSSGRLAIAWLDRAQSAHSIRLALFDSTP